MSRLGQSLTDIFDKSKLFSNRANWASLLGATEQKLSDWEQDKELPRPDHLSILYHVISTSPRTPTDLLHNFKLMINMPAADVSPHNAAIGKNLLSYMNQSAQDYLTHRRLG